MFEGRHIFRVLFDVDGTLIKLQDDSPQEHVVSILKEFSRAGCYVVVHSGGGREYAQMWVDRLELNDYVSKVQSKTDTLQEDTYDISFDDMPEAKFAKVNISKPFVYHE